MTASYFFGRHRWLAVAAAVWGALAAASVAPRVTSHGLIATYYSGPEWSDAPHLVAVDRPTAADWLQPVSTRFEGRTFSATWQGWLRVPDAGIYQFVTASDDGSWLALDDVVVVDNGGERATEERRGQIALTAGLHPLRIAYFQAGGGAELRVQWGPEGGPLAPLTAASLYPTRLAATLQPMFPESRAATPWPPGLLLAGATSGAMLGAVVVWGVRRTRRHTSTHAAEPAENTWLWRLLALSAGLLVWQSWYGIPTNWTGWEGDELRARDVLDGLDRWFSGGWFDLYPPVYHYVLGALSLPFRLAALAGAIDLWSDGSVVMLSGLYRAASVLCGVAIVYLTYRCGLEASGRRDVGLWAGVVAAVLPNFVYLAKLAKPDIPYIVPFMAAMLFYLRCLRDPQPRLFAAFAAAAMIATCVKDQAYALFVFPSLHLAWLRWRRTTGTVASRLAALVGDPALTGAIGTGVAVFVVAHNLLLNFAGFRGHLRLIFGSGSQPYRAYAPTLAGQGQMLLDSLAQVPWIFGWPGTVLVLAGLALAWRQRRHDAVALVLPVVSYYVCCIAVIGFHYDRFYMAPAMLLAVLAGWALATLTAASASWARTLAICAAVYAAARGASVNLLMMRDSRYAAEAWLREHVPAEATVGYFGQPAYLPRPGPLKFVEMDTEWDTVEVFAPEFLVVNTEFARRENNLSFYTALFMGQHPTYRPVARFKSSPGPALLLANDRVFWNGVEDWYTNLDKINPDIQIYERLRP